MKTFVFLSVTAAAIRAGFLGGSSGDQQSLIRVISRSSGPAHVVRVLHQAVGPQAINVHKPGPAPARIVQVVREPAPALRIEFLQEPESQNRVYVVHAPAGGSSRGSTEEALLGNLRVGGAPYGGSYGGARLAEPAAVIRPSLPAAAQDDYNDTLLALGYLTPNPTLQ
ncbi:hypothetical protein BIW11_00679 [Tropilaelaps mercedesae]|uniref:Uncharacterized protein n=1 Tax=Tropilaelaps mercedesae TaxID=418985 RepID=A0A1V9XR91_9ACAR|nr:hypothetical protein BIW11_00679 [Tropilaelaps mercedesae]